MTDTHAETGANGSRPAPVRTYTPAEMLTMMDPSEYPDVSFKDGDDNKKLKFAVAQAGLNWLYANRRTVFADMMLAVYGIDAAPVKPRGGR